MNHKNGTKFNFAIVARANSVEDYDLLKKRMQGKVTEEEIGNPIDITIIYEKTSRDKLMISEEKME